MKAKVISTGEIIDAVMCMDEPELFLYKGTYYQKSELEFLPDTPEEVTIEGYVARDQKRNRNLNLHYEKPFRDYHDANDYPQGFWDNKREFYFPLPDEAFPEITWCSEPLKVKITITPME